MGRRDEIQRERARAMRKDPTWAEFRLWESLRRRQLGVRFRRQHPVGPYIVDFAALQPGLVVEADGASHDCETPQERAQRDGFLRESGLAVLHFTDEEIDRQLESVLFVIRATLSDPDFQWIHEENPW